MLQLIYDMLTTIAGPIAKAWLSLDPKRKELLARFHAPPPRGGESPIWVHACSVGELSVARPVMDGLAKRLPGIPLLLSVSTQTAYAMASAGPHAGALVWFPVDQPSVVRRFFDSIKPRALVLIETEIWPNVLREAQRRGIPALVVNARISDKHYTRYKKRIWFFRAIFARLTAVGAQHPLYADRFAEFGVSDASIHVTGNIKFDNLIRSVADERISNLRHECGIPPDADVVVFGSTRPGDETLAASCWSEWRRQFPKAHLIIAPRHGNRLQEAVAPFGEPFLLRSAVKNGQKPAGERILVIDTLGELIDFYALGTVAIVGGSFYPGVNGHNPLEPAALGVPVVFGPYMRNFLDPAEALVTAGAAAQVESPDRLRAAVAELLSDPLKRAALASNAARAITENAGALERSLNLIEHTLLKSGQLK